MVLAAYGGVQPTVLGQHTAVSIAKESRKWKRIAYLKDNEGLLPPSIILVGDRRRVLSAVKLLEEPILLHEETERLVGSYGSGRVNVAVGIFELKGKPLPLTILETQMGCSAQDIIAWEVLVNSRRDGYLVDGVEVPAKALVAIRAGTCGGIIITGEGGVQNKKPVIKIGDAIIAVASIGDGAVVRQRLGCGSCFDRSDLARFRALWRQRGHSFTSDGRWPLIHASPNVEDALAKSCAELGLVAHRGVNFTKESLYLEGDEEWVKSLRIKYGVLSTEMEHFGLAFLTEELTRLGITAFNGLISMVVGTVPGGSFAAPGSEEEKRAKEGEYEMLRATMHALWKLAYGT